MGDTYQLTAVATTAPCSSMTGPLTLSLRIHCRINNIAVPRPPATGCFSQTRLREDDCPQEVQMLVCVSVCVSHLLLKL